MSANPNLTQGASSTDDGHFTLSCPQCASALRTAAGTAVEGPCPVCGTAIRFQPPRSPVPPATFVPRPSRPHNPNEPEFEKPRSRHAPRAGTSRAKHSRHHSWIRRARGFLKSNTGRLVLCACFAALIVFSVVALFKWDEKRRTRKAHPAPPATEEVPTERTTNPAE